MTVVMAWGSVAVALAAGLRRLGPWWRVAIGCAAWPAWPLLIGASYAKFRIRRRSKGA